MTKMLRAARLINSLDYDDIRVLQGIELGMRRWEFVPADQIRFYARLNKDSTQFHLDRLHHLGLLQRSSNLGYIGYQLIMDSYDILALHSLFKQNVIRSIGQIIARGKESDVHYALTPEDEMVAIKIHRIGQTSFRQVKKLRTYVGNRRHISWLYISRLSAEREFKALKRIENIGIKTPKAYGQNRHMVVLEIIEGRQLSEIHRLDNPEEVLDEILNQIKVLYQKAELIHCDLSEFNIIITSTGLPVIIDYPQWVEINHPNSQSLLKRDVENIHTYFLKHYNLDFDVEAFIADLIESKNNQKTSD